MSTATLRKYYELTKPGIIYGNLIPAVGGFLLASGRYFPFEFFIETMLGLAFVIGSACVFNNALDRDIDAKMERTAHRALVKGEMAKWSPIIYGTVLEFLGFFILALFTNGPAVFVAAVGFVVYVIFYSMWFKRHSVWGTVVGSISGATPPVVGYLAVAGRFDAAALILFLILVFWQMPHFYAIAIFRLKDYEAAKIPVLPAKEGLSATKVQMLFYIVAFTAAAAALSSFGYANNVYLVIALLLGLIWFTAGIGGFFRTDTIRWAREMFFISLIVLTALFLTIGIGALA